MPKYNRILLKLSGEAMAGEAGFGIEAARVAQIAAEIQETAQAGVQIGIVVGGGNFFRGLQPGPGNLDRVVTDQMGMLATVINA
ncbi:MAG TPA: UMP kinase, partial [Bryobacterales bacterium]|nr:UMP kinase [Bryobacterales bacterium]